MLDPKGSRRPLGAFVEPLGVYAGGPSVCVCSHIQIYLHKQILTDTPGGSTNAWPQGLGKTFGAKHLSNHLVCMLACLDGDANLFISIYAEDGYIYKTHVCVWVYIHVGDCKHVSGHAHTHTHRFAGAHTCSQSYLRRGVPVCIDTYMWIYERCGSNWYRTLYICCLLYTSDAADE